MENYEKVISDSWEDDKNMPCSIKNMYMKEINEYPLLSVEEEKYYGNMLMNPRDKKLLFFSNDTCCCIPSLNINLLFYSLCDNDLYESIIQELIMFFDTIKNSKNNTVNILRKYQSEAQKVNRPLNADELKKLFAIDVNLLEKGLSKKDLLKEIKSFMNYKIAFNKMFESNLRLVVSIVSNYNGLNEMDMISEGNLGLISAIVGYDASLGFKFSTYATPCIKKMVRRYLYNNISSVRLPDYLSYKVYAFKKQLEKAEQEEQRELADVEIAQKFGMPLELVQDYLTYMAREVSLDNTIATTDGELTIKDVIPSDDNVEDAIMKEDTKNDIKHLLEILSDRERDVIKMRFGLDEYEGKMYTFRQMAKKYSVSNQCITQVFHKALYKVKRKNRDYINRNY